jgi:mannose-6-phosphate isomerase-like protein (cupin superfamily)
MSPDSVAAPVEPTMLVIPPEVGRTVAAFGSVAVFQLEGSHTAGNLCLAFAETPPDMGPPPHVHHRDDELFLVLQGELSFLTPTGWVKTTPGTAVYIPRGVVHTFRNTGTTPSRHWALTSPSGFERFYTKAAEMFASGTANPDRLQTLAREHGYEFLPPGAYPPPTGPSR